MSPSTQPPSSASSSAPTAFLDPHEAQRSEQRQILPRPPTPEALDANRLGIAYARQHNGELALIGLTLRDLRQGWDTMGGTGSGKSSLIETMVFEIARIGGGCGVADRLLRILPREAYDRGVVIDTTTITVGIAQLGERRRCEVGERWQQSWYCHRCHVAFVAGLAQAVAPEQCGRLLTA